MISSPQNGLPNLPRVLKQHEADAGIVLRNYLMKHPESLPATSEIEVKQTTKDYIAFNCLEDHQVRFNLAVQNSPHGVLVRVQGTNGEADYSWKRRVPVFIAIKFPKSFEVLSLDSFLLEKTKRKSLSSKRAKELSVFSI